MATVKLSIAEEIKAIENEMVEIITNEGTFGNAECCRKVGCGDARFGNYTISERIGGGGRIVVGADPAKAPGYARRLNRDYIREQRRRLAELRRELRQSR